MRSGAVTGLSPSKSVWLPIITLMDASAIAALSTNMAASQAQNTLATAATKKAIDSQRSLGAAMVQLLDINVGTQLDVAA